MPFCVHITCISQFQVPPYNFYASLSLSINIKPEYLVFRNYLQ